MPYTRRRGLFIYKFVYWIDLYSLNILVCSTDLMPLNFGREVFREKYFCSPSATNNSAAHTGRSYVKFYFGDIHKKTVDKVNIFSWSSPSHSWRFRRVYCSLILKMSFSLHLFLGRPTFFRPIIWFCIACFGILFAFSHFSCYCFISSSILSSPVFPLIHWLFFYLVLLFQASVSNMSSVLLLNALPHFSSVLSLTFPISTLV